MVDEAYGKSTYVQLLEDERRLRHSTEWMRWTEVQCY